MISRVVGSFLFAIGCLLLVSVAVLIIIAIWLPHGGYPRGQLIGTSVFDFIIGLSALMGGAVLLGWVYVDL